MTRETAAQQIRANRDLIGAAVAIAVSLGFALNTPAGRIEALERKQAMQDSTLARVESYARAAAIDLCLTRPDSVLVWTDLDCRELLRRSR